MNQEEIDLRDELDRIDQVLNECNASQSHDRAQRIRDSFQHFQLVADAAVFEAQKAEQSVRAQCTMWMGLARSAALRILGEEAPCS